MAIVALALLVACATPSGTTSSASMSIPLSGRLQAISDVEGPYGAVLYGAHAVAIRLWPDSLDDGLAEITVIVTNGSWNTIALDANNIGLTLNGDTETVLGRSSMLARINDSIDESSPRASVATDSLTERQATPESSTPDGGMEGSRLGSEVGALAVDPALAAAARRANTNRRPVPGRASSRNLDERRARINDWYLETIEIYPGDTGTGGISIAVPDGDADLELHVSIGDEDYVFPIRYRTRQ